MTHVLIYFARLLPFGNVNSSPLAFSKAADVGGSHVAIASTCTLTSDVSRTVLSSVDVLAQFENMSTGKALMALAAVIFIITILNMKSRRKRLGPKPRRQQADQLDYKAQGLRRELESLVVELSEFSRQANGQIDTRFAKLEKSLRDADERIAELTALLEASGMAVPSDRQSIQTGQSDANLSQPDGRIEGLADNARTHHSRAEDDDREFDGESTTHPTVNHPPAGHTRQDDRARGVRGGNDDDVDASILAANRAAAAGVRGGARRGNNSVNQIKANDDSNSHNREAQIFALVDNGMTLADVAHQLNCSIGEVELVLNLRGRGD